MNKKLMAVAVAGALSAPGLAVAQVGGSPGVTLYGVIDASFLRNTFSGVTTAPGGVAVSEVTKYDIFPAGNRVGVRGREDLGGGNALWFQLEAGAWVDGRTEQSTTNGVMFGGRNSGIGASSAMGDLMVGGWDSPYKVTTDQTYNLVTSGPFSSSGIMMGNGDTTGAAPNALCGTSITGSTGTASGTGGAAAGAAQATCVTEVTGSTKSFHRRLNNTIQYWSPVFSGVQFKLATQLANYQSPSSSPLPLNGDLQQPKLRSGNVVWTRGPILVAGGYETHQGYNPGTQADGIANPKDTAIQIGGKFDFGMGQVGVGYEQLKYGSSRTGAATTNAYKQANYVVNGRFNVGPGAIWAGYTKTPGGKSCDAGAATVSSATASAVCGADSAAKQLSVGYDYILSKRTKVYAAYSKIDNGLGTNYYYVAGPAANEGGGPAVSSNATINGTAGGLLPGTDVTTIGLGVQHTF